VELSDVNVKVEATVINLTMSDEEDDTIHVPIIRIHKRARSSNSSSFESSVSLSTPSTPRSSPDETEDNTDNPLPTWPTEFYVVDIIQGFEKCEEARRGRRSVRQAFIKHFKVPFRRTTYYNHRQHWDKASAALRDKSLRAKCTTAGLWTTFIERSRAEAKGPVDKKKKKRG
jgi:hypothetical protein